MVVGSFTKELGTVVIGAGPGGYVAAIRAAQLGQKVTVIEKATLGGVCLNVGCIPSKALINAGHKFHSIKNSEVFGISVKDVQIDFKKTQEWKDNSVVKKLNTGIGMLFKKNNIELIRGEATLTDNNTLRVISGEEGTLYNFENLIIATGSRPLEIKGFEFKGRVLDSTGLLNIKELPKKLVVIGGGYIGCELAGAFANLGTEVTILEASSTILPTFSKDMVNLVIENFKKLGVKIITNAFAKNSTQDDTSVKVSYEVDGNLHELDTEYVMVSVGRVPNTDGIGLESTDIKLTDRKLIEIDEQCRTSVENIFAIGDVVKGDALAHKASYEGKVAAEVISGKKVKIDYIGMPSVCYTDPELASVGLTKEEAIKQGIEIVESSFSFASNGRALTLNDNQGFVRLISRKDNGVLIGAQVAGNSASDLMGELSLAIECQITVEDIGLTIHAHPTLVETIMDAAEGSMGMAIHM